MDYPSGRILSEISTSPPIENLQARCVIRFTYSTDQDYRAFRCQKPRGTCENGDERARQCSIVSTSAEEARTNCEEKGNREAYKANGDEFSPGSVDETGNSD
jgi:hypothetical protein